MKEKDLEKLKKEYLKTPIPEELDIIVKKTVKDSRVYGVKRKSIIKKISVAVASLAVTIAVLTVGLNSNPAFATTLVKIPLIGGIVEVLTFKEYTVNKDRFNANIKVPSIQGLDNKDLESSLNQKYLKENEKLYAQFQADMEDMKESGGGHLGVDSGYLVKTDNDRILSIGRYVVNTAASSSTTFKYDTIDKEKEILLTLPSLFADDSYVDVISENIKSQMQEQMKADENKIYWVEGVDTEYSVWLFEEISAEQNFYIDSDNKLVISFDKYEVAPGYMGVVEFVIPTEVIADILVGNEYIN